MIIFNTNLALIDWVDLKKSCCVHSTLSKADLTSESIQGLALTLEGIDDIHGSDCLSAGVLSVGDTITNDILEEDLQDSTSFFIDESRNTLDTTTTGKTTDGRLGNTLDIITKYLSVTLGATLSKAFASFTTTRHDEFKKSVVKQIRGQEEVMVSKNENNRLVFMTVSDLRWVSTSASTEVDNHHQDIKPIMSMDLLFKIEES